MRLELNNSGSWKVILHDIDPEHVEAVRAAVLELLACDRSSIGRACWKLTEQSDVHPGGKTLAVTQGAGAEAKWAAR
jgi:hypothetical protein